MKFIKERLLKDYLIIKKIAEIEIFLKELLLLNEDLAAIAKEEDWREYRKQLRH